MGWLINRWLFYTFVALLVVSSPVLAQTDYPRGVMAVVDWQGPPAAQTLTLPFVQGVVLRLYWRDLYTNSADSSSLNWNLLDQRLALVANAGKTVHLIIAPGFYSPQWVLDQVPLTSVSFTVPQGPDQGQVKPLPLLWDDQYLNLWFNFVTQLAQHLANHPEVAYLSITGPNSHNGEVSLPRDPADEDAWMTLASQLCSDCPDRDTRQQWLADQLTGAWKKTIDKFTSLFSSQNKYVTWAPVTASLPLNNPTLQQTYIQNLISYGSIYPSFGVQNNGFDGRPICPINTTVPFIWQQMASQSGSILTGFQTELPGNLFNCPGTSQTDILQQVAQNVLTYQGKFLEVYEVTANDPQFSSILTTLSQQLSPSPTPTPLPGDVNKDNQVNVIDYVLLVSNFGQAYPDADFNKNGTVDVIDYVILVSNFGKQ